MCSAEGTAANFLSDQQSSGFVCYFTIPLCCHGWWVSMFTRADSENYQSTLSLLYYQYNLDGNKSCQFLRLGYDS